MVSQLYRAAGRLFLYVLCLHVPLGRAWLRGGWGLNDVAFKLQSVKTAKVVMGLYVGRYYEPLGRQRCISKYPVSLGWGSRLAHPLGICTAVPCWNCSARIFDL